MRKRTGFCNFSSCFSLTNTSIRLAQKNQCPCWTTGLSIRQQIPSDRWEKKHVTINDNCDWTVIYLFYVCRSISVKHRQTLLLFSLWRTIRRQLATASNQSDDVRIINKSYFLLTEYLMFPECLRAYSTLCINTISTEYENIGLKSTVLSIDNSTIFIYSFTIVNFC